MNYIEGFRDPAAAAALSARLRSLAGELAAGGRTARIMEVCGSHTMAVGRYGIRGLLPRNVRLISGPGCPVCVTEPGYIDAAIALARGGTTVVSFGDMLRTPGSESTLAECRAAGGSVEVCYSPRLALDLAAANPGREFVFLAIGFETTIGPVVGTLDRALRNGIANLSLLTAFKLVPPALAALLADAGLRIDAFLCPAHVSSVIGAAAYEPFAGKGGVPCVIAGFEPLDILYGLCGILGQLARGESRVENQYSRVVRRDGNPAARSLIERYLEPVDARWRGLGLLPRSGLGLRAAFRGCDAEARHGIRIGAGAEPAGCLCGDVIKGKIDPPDCPRFGKACTPAHPVGPCMVSAEGSCAAYHKYGRGGPCAEAA